MRHILGDMDHPLTAWRRANGDLPDVPLPKMRLARLLGLEWRALHRIERGESRPTLAVGVAVERITGGAVTGQALLDAFDAAEAARAAAVAPKAEPEAAA